MPDIIETTISKNLLKQKVSALKADIFSAVREVEELFDCPANKETEICVKFLSGTLENDTFVDLFTTGEIGKAAENLKFSALPITQRIEEYKKPLILISDDYEIDNNINILLQSRRINNYRTFPVIIFSEDFFTRRKGQSLAYIQIIETLEQATNKHTMAFKRSDIKQNSLYVKTYTDYISCIVSLTNAISKLNELEEYLSEAIEWFIEESNDITKTYCKRLSLISYAKVFYNFLATKIKLLEDNLQKKLEESESIIVELRNLYDLHIDGLIRKEPIRVASPIAVQIDLKYGHIKEQFEQYTDYIHKSKLFTQDFLNSAITEELRKVTQNVQDILSTSASELSLIGTFSSGKTTMINTLLGHSHKLRTSMNHNTAVLTRIMQNGGHNQQEHYYVKQKDKLVWTLIKPTHLETKIYKNPFFANSKVLRIIEEKDGYKITIQNLDNREIQTLVISRNHKLSIKEGSKIEPNQTLTRTDQLGEEITLASKNEIELLISLFKSKEITEACITVTYDKGKIAKFINEKALVFLENLSKYYRYSEVRDSITPDSTITKISGHLNIKELVKAEIEAKVNIEGKDVILNEKTWIDFSGDDKNDISIENVEKPFCERPECYMLAEQIDIYLDSEFLEYCSLNDTPGCGSVTEEHDATTERFVARSSSNLLVMISINSKSKSAGLIDLLNFIANIFKNYRKNQMDEVFFVLNCFSGSTSEQKLKSDVKDISDNIIRSGFLKENIYVCDLRKATECSQEIDKMWGFPSYAAFRKDFINGTLENGLKKKYNSAYKLWQDFLDNSIARIKQQLKQQKNDLEDGIRNKGLYEQRLKDVRAVQERYFSDFYKQIKTELYDDPYDLLRLTFLNNKRTNWFKRQRREECERCIEQWEELTKEKNNEFMSKLVNEINRSLSSLDSASGDYISSKSLTLNQETFIFIPFDTIKKLVLDADKDAICFNPKKGEIISECFRKLKVALDDECRISLDIINRFVEEYLTEFRRKKREKEEYLKNELANLDNPELIKKQISNYEEIFELLKQSKDYFEKTVDIDMLRS